MTATEPDVVVEGAGRVRLRFQDPGSETRFLGETRVPSGTTIFDAASWNAIAIDSTCGGHGTCKKCRVRVVDGAVAISSLDPRAFTPDELRGGWRLACRAAASEDLLVEVPPLQTRPKAALVGVGRHVILRPGVQKRHLELTEPTLEDQVSDLERVLAAMDDLELRVGLDVVRELGGVLRRSGYDVTAVIVDDELIDLEPGDTTARRFALAFDLGTTTVVANLLDVDTGQPLAVSSMLNRQSGYGADVIARISATMIDADALADLRRLAHETLAELAREVCEEAGVEAGEVYEIVVAGNVTMIQLALGIDPEPLGMSPFTVAARRLPAAQAADFGVSVHRRAPAVTFPALGAYVGGDIVAGLLATGVTHDRRIRLFIDVGTNCELVLGSSERVVATAAPAGPAFEGASIRCGMRAAEGAIEGVAIEDGDIAIQVIGDTEPTGICGSGLVDVAAVLLEQAAALHPALAKRLVQIPNAKGHPERVFVLAWRGDDPAASVYLSQVDVRRLQEGKAAIATGWQMLARELGVEPGDIAQVLLAGSFGAYLTPASAVRIGLVPKLSTTRIVAAGNVAGEGAKIAALSVQERAAAVAILDEVEYVEASGNPDYNDLFIEELTFPA